mmetsp:Transcript_16377/g.38731  ORF Transcript_16377/g.38731 Transcript_16377/m.38731 type:complete len:113 (+) Transcript_16377:105-443(+)
MSRKPAFDAPMVTNQLDKPSRLSSIGMVEPTTAIDNVVLLQGSQSRSQRRCVTGDKNFPPLAGRMLVEHLFEPIDLRGINGDFVRRVFGSAKDGGGQAHEERLGSNGSQKLG